ncbi:MAG TPA: hypothetical protein DIU18_04515, partial [Gemmatimonadetes bacterium]|nr:hypothetical protein [Gemmatimonadota bacterium]
MNVLKSWLASLGLAEPGAEALATLIVAALVALVGVVAHVITRRILLRLVRAAARRTTTTWDDI